MTTTDSQAAAAPDIRPRSLAAMYIRTADLLYVALATCMLLGWLTAAARTGDGWTYVFRNLGVLVLFLGLRLVPLSGGRALRAGGLLRIGLACVVLPFHYLQSGPLVAILNPDAPAVIEAWLAQTDAILLGTGFQEGLLAIRHPVTTEILQLCYGSFYLLPLVLVVVLILRGKRAEVPVLLLVVPATFLISYAVYMLLPARSPAFLDEQLAPTEGLWLAPYLWTQIRAAAEGIYDAFPSGHTAVTLVVLWYAWRLDRVAFAILLPVGTGLIVSTIYLQYHYVLDLPAGALLAVGVIAWERVLRRRHAASRPAGRASSSPAVYAPAPAATSARYSSRTFPKIAMSDSNVSGSSGPNENRNQPS